MDYIYTIELVILGLVIISLIVVNYLMIKARKANFRAVVQLQDEVDLRLINLDEMMGSVKDREQELAMLFSIFRSYIKQHSPTLNNEDFFDKNTLLLPPLPVDPRELAADGGLKRRYFGSASYLHRINSMVDQLSKKTQTYFKEIYPLIAETDEKILAESKVTVALQQEITHYIELIQSKISADTDEIINPSDQELINSLSDVVKELSVLNACQTEAQLVSSALNDTLETGTK